MRSAAGAALSPFPLHLTPTFSLRDGKIKIAFLDSWLQSSAEGSGTAVGIHGLQSAFRKMGHDVARCSPKTARGPLLLRRIWFNLTLPFQLRLEDYDLVVGFDIDGFCLRARSAFQYVVSIKGVLAEEAAHETGRWRWILWSLSRLEKLNARKASRVLATSAYCCREIQRHYGVEPEKMSVVWEGIDVPRWRQFIAEHPANSDGRTILCVARQYQRKHVGDLIAAIDVLRARHPKVRAVIVGDGPQHSALRSQVRQSQLEDHVLLTGALASDEEVARWYRHADIFCLPSVQEGFGIVFLEAMVNALPIVATSAAAVGEVVQHGRGGLLVEPGRVDRLAAALETLLGDAELRARFSRFNQAYVEQYDWLKIAERFLSVISTMKIAY
jgi:glycosyltransferase involved in cell wall biosynthesis